MEKSAQGVKTFLCKVQSDSPVRLNQERMISFSLDLIYSKSVTFDSNESDNLMVRRGHYYEKHALFAVFDIHILKSYFSA